MGLIYGECLKRWGILGEYTLESDEFINANKVGTDNFYYQEQISTTTL